MFHLSLISFLADYDSGSEKQASFCKICCLETIIVKFGYVSYFRLLKKLSVYYLNFHIYIHMLILLKMFLRQKKTFSIPLSKCTMEFRLVSQLYINLDGTIYTFNTNWSLQLRKFSGFLKQILDICIIFSNYIFISIAYVSFCHLDFYFKFGVTKSNIYLSPLLNFHYYKQFSEFFPDILGKQSQNLEMILVERVWILELDLGVIQLNHQLGQWEGYIDSEVPISHLHKLSSQRL